MRKASVYQPVKLWRICALLFFLLAGQNGIAQSFQPAFRQYTMEDGLPSLEVFQVFQDSKGYIWFATKLGVTRYDGYEMQSFTDGDGLPKAAIFKITFLI